MNNRKRLEELLEDIIVESSIQYLDAREVSNGPDAQTQETRIDGLVVNEGLVPGLGLGIRGSQAFTCRQPVGRDYVQSADFEMAPDIKWEFFPGHNQGGRDHQVWDEAEVIEILRSHTDMATFNPLMFFD